MFENAYAANFLEDRRMKKADPKYNGPWTPYFETLPMTDCFDYPVNFGEEEMKILDGSHRLRFEVSIRKQQYKAEYNSLKKGVNEFKHFTL